MGPAAAEPQGDANFLGGTRADRGAVNVPGQDGLEVIGEIWRKYSAATV